MKHIHLHVCCRRAFYVWLSLAFLPVTLMAADEPVKSPDSGSGSAAGNVSNGTPFRFERPIELSSTESDRLARLYFDTDLYANTRTGFPDVRIVDQAGQSIPFVVRRSSDSQTTTRYMEWRPVRISLRPLGENGLQILIPLEENDPQPAGFRIVTPLTNFENRVRVFDADTESGIPVVDDAIIYDYSQYMDVRRVDIPLPVTTARTFRIVIDDITAEQESQLLELTRTIQGGRENGTTERLTIDRRPFRIDQIRFWADKAEERVAVPKLRASTVSDFAVSEDAAEHRTVASFRTSGQPVSSVTIQTQDRNFSRLATVRFRSAGSQEWQQVGSAHLARLEVGRLHEESLTIRFEDQRAMEWQVVIDNRDSPPIRITGVEVSGPEWEMVFMQSPGHSYRLLYCSRDAEPARHDTASITAALTAHVAVTDAGLGQITEIPQVIPMPETDLRSVLNNPFLLAAIVVVLVALLAWGLFGAAQRVQQVADEDDRMS